MEKLILFLFIVFIYMREEDMNKNIQIIPE